MIFTCQALLFDLDGTLIDSLPAVDRAWRAFSAKHGLSFEYVYKTIHGRRSIDSIREMLPHVDPVAEDAYIRHLESTDTDGVTPLPGAIEFVNSLPADRWAIVTSGTSDVAKARIKAAGIPAPLVAVYGEDVKNGKPAPDPYLLGAERLGIPANHCVGFEDTLAGLRSIEAAGAASVGVGAVDHPIKISHYLDVKVSLNSEGLIVLELP